MKKGCRPRRDGIADFPGNDAQLVSRQRPKGNGFRIH
jgi:hypothetical protein